MVAGTAYVAEFGVEMIAEAERQDLVGKSSSDGAVLPWGCSAAAAKLADADKLDQQLTVQ